ncbi:LEM-3-like GIY-YIG domain-containing protein [Jannaschia marina]|uniref:LEM-3-like GIY-YIG domain-containing protein n=1 Tax=Jannaschia marina TaxID=2741674 RepID=UPI0015CDAEA1|nr:hypothetical protein [Jannaschia marina]
MTDRFTDSVAKGIGHYVYRLIDPRNGETFYVGKGQGNRVFDHARGDIGNLTDGKDEQDDDQISLKASRIAEIKKAGLQVIHLIHRHNIPKDAVFEVEAAVMDCFPGLSNAQGGHGSGAKGPMSIEEIIRKYGLPKIDTPPRHKLVLININHIEEPTDRDAIYEQVRFAWRINKERAEDADYVLAVVRGVVIGAFVAEKWLPATRENFGSRAAPPASEMPNRKGFVGQPAPDDIWDLYVGQNGKRIEIEAMKHIQNPIRYWSL